ncbi:MAG: zinc ribbon domain-containing protein [Actinomycetota bacterium]|nr:zinc ribbon domain-containing protein [Actinomycetota bacterium]
MPIYEFHCRECGSRFEVRRTATDADAPAPPCPAGHVATRRVLSVFATPGRGSAPSFAMPSGPAAGGGCGPGCACAADA